MPVRCILVGWSPVALALAFLPAAFGTENTDYQKRVEELRQRVGATKADVAREELERLANRKEQLEVRLSEIKQWTKHQFELSERDVIDKPAVMAPLLKRWQVQRENELHRLLQARDKSAGGIESGKALNTLLEHIGSAASENSQSRKINPDYAVPLYGPTEKQQITDDMLRRLGWQDNTLGAKATGRFNQDPMDIEWPPALLDERWAESRHSIEEARGRLFGELRAGRGVPRDLDKQLRASVAQLNADYASYFREWTRNPRVSAKGAQEYHRLCNGKRHIEKLIAAIYQVTEATTIEDVTPTEKFAGGNIEDFLAYMHRNNLLFNTPTKNTDRKAYYQVFDLMVRYYLDLKAVSNAQLEIEREIQRIDRIDEDAIAAALDQDAVVVNLISKDDRNDLQKLIAD